MRNKRTLLSANIILWASLTALPAGQRAARISEVSLRKIAVKTVMPSYPTNSIKQKSKGVGVAELISDEAGLVIKVEILEAPDQLIAAAIKEAVQQWTFKPSRVKDANGPRVKVQGKLTFYFIIPDKGEPRVESPKQFK